MRVLVACEESQAVCKAFRERGHEAYSCDIIECSGGHPEWHIQQDVLPLLNGRCTFKTCDGQAHIIEGKWDLIIAFPPCTHLAVSGARHFEKKRADGRQREGIEFFAQFLTADCEKVAIENPVGIISGDYIPQHFPDLAEKYNLPRPSTQRIHPWMFGDNFAKTTCLWLKGLQPLTPIITDQPEMEWKEWIDKKTGRKKRQNQWYFDALKTAKTPEERSLIRSKTFPGIAKAMAEQRGMNPKFIEHIYLDIKKPPLPAKLDDSGETLMIAEQIAVRSVEQIEDAIVREITHMALEEGIERVYLLDKKNIVSALSKQIPKKPLKKSIEYDGEYGYCPCCNHVIAGYDSNNVCRHCGQALDWGDTE